MVRRTRIADRAATPAEMRSPVQSRAIATIDRVCEAALTVLATGGWDAFNINAVAAAAAVSGPTVYRYFPDKYVLAAELRRRMDDAESMMALPAIRAIGVRSQTTTAIGKWIRAVAESRSGQPAALLLRSIPRSIPDLRQSDGEGEDVLKELAAALGRLNPALSSAAAWRRASALRTTVDSLIDDAIESGVADGQRLTVVADVALALCLAEVSVDDPQGEETTSHAGSRSTSP